MFEKHQHKDQFLKDMSQKQEINRSSEESQKLLVDMNHTEIFKLCENSAKLQWPDCNAFSEIGISTHKKDTEIRWQSTILAKKKSYDYTATQAERLQNAKHWVLRLNADGPQKLPMH